MNCLYFELMPPNCESDAPLMQQHEIQYTVAYATKKLTSAERRYSTLRRINARLS